MPHNMPIRRLSEVVKHDNCCRDNPPNTVRNQPSETIIRGCRPSSSRALLHHLTYSVIRTCHLRSNFARAPHSCPARLFVSPTPAYRITGSYRAVITGRRDPVIGERWGTMTLWRVPVSARDCGSTSCLCDSRLAFRYFLIVIQFAFLCVHYFAWVIMHLKWSN